MATSTRPGSDGWPQAETASTVRPLPNDRCPLCGGANGCAPARSGSFSTPCWCASAAFDDDLLARVPAGDRGRACICSECAARASR